MIRLYYESNRPEYVIEMFINRMNELNYRYYASDLLEKLIHSKNFDLNESLRKAIAILRLTDVPVQDHIKKIYRCNPDGLNYDWKLSELACSLIILSYENPDAEVREYQKTLMEYLEI